MRNGGPIEKGSVKIPLAAKFAGTAFAAFLPAHLVLRKVFAAPRSVGGLERTAPAP